MAQDVPLELVPTDPTGPARGNALGIGEGRVAVLRRGVLGRRTAAVRARADVLEVSAGPPSRLASVAWLSPGAQLAVQREISGVEARGGQMLALRMRGPVAEEVWLFTGRPDAVAAAEGALRGGTAATAGATASGWVVPSDRDGGVRLRGGSGGGLKLLVALALLGVGAFLLLGGGIRERVGDGIDRVRSEITVRIPDAPPGLPDDEPYEITDMAAVATAVAGAPGVALAGPPQPAGDGRWRMRIRWRGTVVTLVLFPDAAAARRAARPGDRRRGNLLIRNAPRPAAAAIIRALGPAG